MVGSPAAGTRGSLTGTGLVWQHTLSFLSHHLLSVLGYSQDPGTCAHMNADANTHTETDTRTHWNISSSLALSVRTSARSLHPSHTDVPLGTSAGCGVAAPGAFLGSGGGGGVAEGQAGPQSLDDSFLCGTQSIVCAGKGHGDGNTAQSWTLSSDLSFLCVCLCESETQAVSLSVGVRKCVLAHDTQ